MQKAKVVFPNFRKDVFPDEIQAYLVWRQQLRNSQENKWCCHFTISNQLFSILFKFCPKISRTSFVAHKKAHSAEFLIAEGINEWLNLQYELLLQTFVDGFEFLKNGQEFHCQFLIKTMNVEFEFFQQRFDPVLISFFDVVVNGKQLHHLFFP